MPKYANFNPAIPAPSPVIGWFDTDFADYGNLLPDAQHRLELTPEQWLLRMNGQWAVDNGALVAYTPPPPVISPQQAAATAYAAKVAQGIAITCTGTPALSAIYALDALTMDQIGSVARDFSSGLGLPGDLDTFGYPDIHRQMHTFTGEQLVALYRKQRNLLAVLNAQTALMAQGQTATWPAQSATIA